MVEQSAAGGVALAEDEAGGQAGAGQVFVAIEQSSAGEAVAAERLRNGPARGPGLACDAPGVGGPAGLFVGLAGVRLEGFAVGRRKAGHGGRSGCDPRGSKTRPAAWAHVFT